MLMAKGGGKPHWESVMFTDGITASEIAESVEAWSVNNTVLAARYNGKEVAIPTGYHWTLESRGEVFGRYATRAEAVEAMNKRKERRRQGEAIRMGIPHFVQD